MSIRTKVVTFSELMEFEGRPYLVIPNFQRPYSWGVEQIEALFEDHFMDIAERASKKIEKSDSAIPEPFVGSVVIKPSKHLQLGACNDVIDGQQRLTTLSIVLASAYRRLEGQTGKGPKSAREAIYVTKTQHRLVPKGCDASFIGISLDINDTSAGVQKRVDTIRAQLRKDKKNDELSRASLAVGKIVDVCLDNFVRFSRRYQMSESAALEKLMDVILNELRIIVVSVDELSQGMTVFEALNARGMPLTVDQLFKNTLMIDFPDTTEQVLISDSWEGDRLSFESMLPKPPHRDKFMLHYYRAFHGHVHKKYLFDSYKSISKRIKQGRDGSSGIAVTSLPVFLSHFLDNARFIARQHPPTLKSIGGEVCRPVLMAVRHYFDPKTAASEEAVKRVAFVLEAALMRFFICDAGVTTLDSNLSTLAADILKGKHGNTPVSVAEGVREFLKTPSIKLPIDDFLGPKASLIHCDKLTGRSDMLLLVRLEQDTNLSVNTLWDADVDASKYTFRYSCSLGPAPTLAQVENFGFESLAEYQQLAFSIGNVLVTPPGKHNPGAFAVNNGLPTQGATASDIRKVLKARVNRLTHIYKI